MGFSKIAVVSCIVGALGIIISYYSLHHRGTEMMDCITVTTEWHDRMTSSVRKFQLKMFLIDKSIEMFDLDTKRLFLKRYFDSGLALSDLYIGNTVIVLTRQLKIVNYADIFTKNYFDSNFQNTFSMIKPDAVHKMGEIIRMIEDKKFNITELRMVHLTHKQAEVFYEEHKGREFFEPLLDYITSSAVVAIQLMKSDAVYDWRKLLGPTDAQIAKVDAPDSVRANFGKDKQTNAAHGSDSYNSANRELSFFFGKEGKKSIPASASFVNSTCCVIKPHAVKAGKAGQILAQLALEEFQITAIQMYRMTRTQAEEFLEVYESVVNDYPDMVKEFMSGPLIAIEISSSDEENIVQKVRNFIGPRDPDMAREIKPNCIRAIFGESIVRNGIHCTDLPEDGAREVEYFFKILNE